MNNGSARSIQVTGDFPAWLAVLGMIGILLFLGLLINLPAAPASVSLGRLDFSQSGEMPAAPQPFALSAMAQVTVTETLTPTVTLTPTSTITPTVTSTSTVTETPTPTGSITPTSTGTLTTTPTTTGTTSVTPTATPTVTGTPPTPTPTGTITPNPQITLSVSPSEARVNQQLTFTIRLTNSGTAAGTNVVVTDPFSTFLDISSATTTKGSTSTNTSSRTVTTTVGSLSPGETVTITIVTRVNSTVTTTRNLDNFATMTYTFGGISQSRTSNTVTFRVLDSSTLPGTGGVEKERPPNNPFWVGFLIAGLLGVTGIAALAYGIAARRRNPSWSAWFARTGLLLAAFALVFGYATAQLQGSGSSPGSSGLSALFPTATTPYLPTADDPWGIYPQATEPEKLPDFPIPTPEIATEAAGEEVDSSAVVRLEIPALGISNEVKYVPYDGHTWLIAGLKQEIAWMGDTSWPGLGGNTGLAGHVTLRDGSDGPFRNLNQLQPGDRILLYTEQNMYTYQVSQQLTVEETDFTILQPSSANQLTLITCSGWDTNMKIYLSRLAVVSDLVEVQALHPQAIGMANP